jgi:hypothetical protein
LLGRSRNPKSLTHAAPLYHIVAAPVEAVHAMALVLAVGTTNPGKVAAVRDALANYPALSGAPHGPLRVPAPKVPAWWP